MARDGVEATLMHPITAATADRHAESATNDDLDAAVRAIVSVVARRGNPGRDVPAVCERLQVRFALPTSGGTSKASLPVAASSRAGDGPVVLDAADFEREFNRILEFIDLWGNDTDVGRGVVEAIAAHYDLDLVVAEPEPRGLIASTDHRLPTCRPGYEELRSMLDQLIQALMVQGHPRGAAIWATEMLVAATGIEGLVSDPRAPDPLTDAKRYVDVAQRLLCRHLAISRGDLDAAF